MGLYIEKEHCVYWAEISLGNWSGKILELKKGNRFFLFRTTEFQPKFCGNLRVDHAAAFVNNNVKRKHTYSLEELPYVSLQQPKPKRAMFSHVSHVAFFCNG